jgi:O-antigen/teichoic acid export membrane protein
MNGSLRQGAWRSPDGAAKLARYALITIGPAANAGSQFVLSLQTLHHLDPTSFGEFSFLLVASVFSWSVWSALFCAPLPVLMAQGAQELRSATLRCVFSASGAAAVGAGAVFWLLELSLGVAGWAAVVFALYACFALLRWYARQYAYVTGAPMRTLASDLVYGVVLLMGVAAMSITRADSLQAPFLALLVAAAASLLPFGRSYFARQFLEFSPRDIPRYAEVWRRHSSWSLIGVATTEATANAHAYMVTFLLGPSAFAPLSASALLIRPIGVVMTALGDFERPRMAKLIHAGEEDDAAQLMLPFRLALAGTWLCTALAALALMLYAPRLIFPARYATDYLAEAAAIWMIVAAVRVARTPESVMLQAAGRFRPLALASVYSSVVSVALVAALLFSSGALFSLFGILIGETVFAIWIRRLARDWRRRQGEEGVAAARPESELHAPAAMRALGGGAR